MKYAFKWKNCNIIAKPVLKILAKCKCCLLNIKVRGQFNQNQRWTTKWYAKYFQNLFPAYCRSNDKTSS